MASVTTGDAVRAESVTVLLVGDHPALRAGLEGLLRHAPGFECVGALPSQRELVSALKASRADVVLLDSAVGGGSGLTACFLAKQLPDPPGVMLYCAQVDEMFAVPATLAQADAIVAKSAPVDHMLQTLRRIAAGGSAMPPLQWEAVDAVTARISADDLAIAGMLLCRLGIDEIAETLRLQPREVFSRALRIIRELQAGDDREPRQGRLGRSAW